MKRMARSIVAMGWLVLAAEGRAETVGTWRNPTPEGVSFSAAVGGVVPVGTFGDVAQSGVAFMGVGHYRVNQWWGPVASFQWAFLEPDESVAGGLGSLDTFNVLLGVRGYFVPETISLRPYGTIAGGWAHYTSYRDLNFTPVFGVGDNTRDDPVFSGGGGFEANFTPNFSAGFDVHALLSFARTESHGERDLTAVSISGMLTFRY